MSLKPLKVPKPPKPPKLPLFLENKIYKTGQTRGATDDEIFQNRVGRCSTVLIPLEFWDLASKPPEGENRFEAGYIALVNPRDYFEGDAKDRMAKRGLILGENALVFYQKRGDWVAFSPAALGWSAANSRTAPLGGEYVSRIASTTSKVAERLNHGFSGKPKGAGIRPYEYASAQTIADCRTQLEAVFWRCADASDVSLAEGMSAADIQTRKAFNVAAGNARDLLDLQRLTKRRVLDHDGFAMCPLCLARLSAREFLSRIEQAEGRAVHDQTVTQVNLFHIDELRLGRYGHRPYNIGWGHHHCNVVVKDAGIDATLMWMSDVVGRNVTAGYLTANKGPSPPGA